MHRVQILCIPRVSFKSERVLVTSSLLNETVRAYILYLSRVRHRIPNFTVVLIRVRDTFVYARAFILYERFDFYTEFVWGFKFLIFAGFGVTVFQSWGLYKISHFTRNT